MFKKLFLSTILALGLVSVQAQPFPTQPIKIINYFPVGSFPDVASRKIANSMSKSLNVPVIVENKPGGSGAVAMEYVIKQPADGYTIVFLPNDAMSAYPLLHNSKYKTLIDPLVPVLKTDVFLITSSKIKNINELLKSLPNLR